MAKGGSVDPASPTRPWSIGVHRLARRPTATHRVWGAAILVGLAALVPRLLAAGRFNSVDEQRWMVRSERFIDALVDLRWSEASSSLEGVATMPGITTVWVGGVAKQLWRLLDDTSAPFHLDPSAWATAQVLAAIVNSVLLVVLWWVVRRWMGPIVAITATLLLATEPFMVAHGAVLHTDSFLTLFATISIVAMLVSLGLPSPSCTTVRAQRWFACVAGVAFAGALLTKLHALLFGPFLLVIVVVALRADVEGSQRHDLLRLTGIAIISGLVTVFVMWPALWLDPSGQLEVLQTSAGMAGAGHFQFFRGEITWTPGVWYYPFVFAYRASPWLLASAAAGMVVSAVDPTRRPHLPYIAGLAVVPVVVLSVAAKQIDRYAMVVWPVLALFAGIAIAALHERSSRSTPSWLRWSQGLLAAAAIAMIVHAAAIAPAAIAWFSPATGGSAGAEQTLLIGWGEGLEVAGQRIAAIEGGACAQRQIATVYRLPASFPCGDLVVRPNYDQLRSGDYLVLYIGERQRSTPDELDALLNLGEVVDEVWISGIRYAEIIRVD